MADSQQCAGEARGSKGLVTSPHVLASEEGRRVLVEGGNAIEAAIAMAATLAVVYPHFNGLGGDAVWIIADAVGRNTCLLGIGQAAADCSGYADGVPVRGARSAATTAGAVDSWGCAHEFSRVHWSGRIAFSPLLQRAIELAEQGFPVSPSQSFWLDFRRAEVSAWPGFSRLFATCASAAPFVQRDLAASLRTIAGEGPRSFYEGPLAQRIVHGLRGAGSPLSTADFAATHTQVCAPLALDYRGHVLLAPPAPTQGATTLIAMGLLERLAIAETDPASANYYHLVVEAIKQAFLVREGICDPDFAAVPTAEWLSTRCLDRLARAVDPARAAPWPNRFRRGDTVFLAAVDAQGRAASVLQSTYFDWGSGTVAGDTGILWHNRAAAFSGGDNRIRPGARPFHTLNPGIAIKDGRPRILYGTQGADGQPQTLATLLPRLIDHRFGPLEALAAPRFLLGRTFSDSNDTLKIEEDAGPAVLAELCRYGHALVRLPPASPLTGQAGIILVENGGAIGAHDPRSDGAAKAAQ